MAAQQNKADSQYIQQHLANERTFLAWTRTAIAVIGLGFLAAGVVFRTSEAESAGHLVAAIIGIGSVLLGGVVVACATRDYFIKRTSINDRSFQAPKLTIWITFFSLGLVDLFLIALVVILLWL
jgi:putative membrane protein